MKNIYLYVRKKFRGSKRGLALTLILMICLQVFAFASEVQAYTYSGGDGTTLNPYEIWTVADLDNVRNGLSSSYILMNDLDLSSVANWIPIGEDYAFSGNFDGQNFTISNMVIDKLNELYAGLFGRNVGSIKNVGLKDVNMTSINDGYVSGGAYVGALVGLNSGVVDRCYSTGVVNGSSNVGGLIGNNTSAGLVTNSYSHANVTGKIGYSGSDYYLRGRSYYVGGLVGRNSSGGIFRNCYATGDVLGIQQVGGFIGNHFEGTLVVNCYATGNVTGYEHVGGFAGRNYSSSTISNVYSTGAVTLIDGGNTIGGLIGFLEATLNNGYYDGVKSGQSDAGKGMPKSSEEMMQQETFAGFNFTDIWTIDENRITPYLKTNIPSLLPNLINSVPTTEATLINVIEDTVKTGTLTGCDSDGDTLQFSVLQTTTQGVLTVSATGDYSYSPNQNFNGIDGFIISISDPYTTTQAAVTVVVLPVDDEPIALGKTVVIDEDTLATGTVPIIDVDDLIISYGVVSQPTNGQLAFNNHTGAFLYEPNLNFNGKDEFVYSVSSAITTTQAVVTLQINPINDAPIATAESYGITRNQSFTRTLKVSDVDSSSFTFSIISDPTSGSIVINSVTGEFTYSSPSVGTDQFTYCVSDGQATDTAVISIQVHEIVYPSTNVNQVSGGGGTTVGGSHSPLAGVKADGQGSIGFSVVPQGSGSTQIELTLNSQDLAKVLKGILEKQSTLDNQVDDDQGDNGQSSEGQAIATPQPHIEVSVNSQDSNVQINMSVQDIQNMQEAHVIFDVKTDLANYLLSTDAIDLEEILKAFGEGVDPKDIQLSIKIKQPDDKTVAILQGSTTEQGLRLVVPPIEFEIEYTYKGQTVIGSRFKRYVERQIPIPAGVDPSTITTAVVLEEDGTLRPVPTRIEKIDGVFYAVINSLTNSIYALIHNEARFIDVTNHWAQVEIQDMTSRLILQGSDGVNYAPNCAITRAEFATIIVKALGLTAAPSNQIFTDVLTEFWFYPNIHTAVSYDLVKGSEGSFRPQDFISRQEACTIMSRALQVMGAKEVQDSDVLDGFVDTKEIATWALESIEQCMKEEILQGKSGGYIKPKDLLTRAEAAVMVYRMLVKKGLI